MQCQAYLDGLSERGQSAQCGDWGNIQENTEE